MELQDNSYCSEVDIVKSKQIVDEITLLASQLNIPSKDIKDILTNIVIEQRKLLMDKDNRINKLEKTIESITNNLNINT